jgi:predicted nucleic acid-binding protein
MSYTIDASVFVSAAFSKEIHHQESLNFLSAVRKQGEDIFVPRWFWRNVLLQLRDRQIRPF